MGSNTKALRRLISRQTDAALNLTKHVVQQTEANNSNLVFSPLSINVVLSMIAALFEGRPIHDQLLSFLKAESNDQLNSLCSEIIPKVFADGSPAGGPCLSFANGVWMDESLTFKPAFREILNNVYKAECNLVDFQTKAAQIEAEVNSWAEKKTNGLIKNVLPPGFVEDTTKLILANAIYFKGAWNQPFYESETKDYDFFLGDERSVVKVPFMTSKKMKIIGAYDGFKVLKLPYGQGRDKNRRFSMSFFLPDAKDGLPFLIERMSSESGFIERHLPHESVQVGKFRIPKFKISFGFNVSEILNRLGLELPRTAITQKSFIEVNEEGTEAAAVTVGELMLAEAPFRAPRKIDFVADHPFLFVISEQESGAILFIGHVLNPFCEDTDNKLKQSKRNHCAEASVKKSKKKKSKTADGEAMAEDHKPAAATNGDATEDAKSEKKRKKEDKRRLDHLIDVLTREYGGVAEEDGTPKKKKRSKDEEAAGGTKKKSQE